MHFVMEAMSKIVSTVIASLRRLQRAHSESLAVHHDAIMSNQYDAARNRSAGHRRAHDLVNVGKSRAVIRHFRVVDCRAGGCALRQQSAVGCDDDQQK